MMDRFSKRITTIIFFVFYFLAFYGCEDSHKVELSSGKEIGLEQIKEMESLDKISYVGLENVFSDTKIISPNGKPLLLIFAKNNCIYCDKFKDNLLVRYSAFVAFPYDLRIAEFIKKMPLFSYNSKDKIWEIPIYELPKLCNKFTDCDIHITGTYHKIAKSDKKIPKGFKFKTKPYKYQKEGVEFALSKERFILGDECGLGKSKMVIDFCGCLKYQKLINKVLI